MRNAALILAIMTLLLPLGLAATPQCDDFCENQGFEYGTCLPTTEAGHCGGNENEKPYGFDKCEDFNRCCCGNQGIASTTVVEEEPTEETLPTGDFSATEYLNERSMAENMFWFLLVLVIILAIANIVTPKRKKKHDLEDLI